LIASGAPLTSGSAAKHLLKYAAPAAPGAWPAWLDGLLPAEATERAVRTLERHVAALFGAPR
jgi:hypothetical protein